MEKASKYLFKTDSVSFGESCNSFCMMDGCKNKTLVDWFLVAFVCLLSQFWKSTKSQQVKSAAFLDKETQDKFLFDRAKNLWFQYIETLLHKNCKMVCRQIQANITVNIDMETFYSYSWFRSRLFLGAAKTLFLTDPETNLLGIDTTNKVTRPNVFINHRPTGRFYVHNIKEKYFSVRYRRMQFSLDFNFKLNITLVRVHTFYPVYGCALRYHPPVMIVPIDQPHRLLVSFCGIYSGGQIYPIQKSFEIQVVPFGFTLADMWFSVLDSGIVHSLTTKSAAEPKPEFCLVFSGNLNLTFLFSFHLQVNKFQVIALHNFNASNVTVRVFDGPLILSKELTTNLEKSFQTSTFQCIIHIIAPVQQFNLSSFMIFKAKRNYVKTEHLFGQAESKPLLLQTPMIHEKIFHSRVYNITCTTNHSFLNLSTNSLSMEGAPSHDCRFAGLAVYDELNGALVEHRTICKQHFVLDKDYRYRPIHSLGRTVVAVFYCFNLYAEVTISLSFSSTQCKPITVNVCEFKLGVFQNFFDTTKPGYLTLNLPASKCLNVQFVSEKSNQFKSSCKVFIKPMDYFDSGLEMEFQVTGYFFQSNAAFVFWLVSEHFVCLR